MKVRFITRRKIYLVILLAFFGISLFVAFPVKKKTSEKQSGSATVETRVTTEGNVEKTEYVSGDVVQRYTLKTTDGNTVLTEYFDGKGKPKKQSKWYYAILKEYDEAGNALKTTYLGMDGQPVTTKSGYAILRRTYYDREPIAGKVENEYYFDVKDEPKALSHGQYGLHNEYDEKGRVIACTYLGADGKPKKGDQGYATVKKTYYDNGSLDTETYYDEYGKPVALSLGQYGTKRINGRKVYINAKGREMFALRNHLFEHLISVMIAALLISSLAMILGKKGNVALLALFLLCIAYMTLLYRNDGNVKPELELFWSYKKFFSSQVTRKEIINNIWLFLPLGTILCRLQPRWRAVLIAVAISVGIEFLQYVTGLGAAEVDDVLNNGLGAMLGTWFGYVTEPLAGRKKRV